MYVHCCNTKNTYICILINLSKYECFENTIIFIISPHLCNQYLLTFFYFTHKDTPEIWNCSSNDTCSSYQITWYMCVIVFLVTVDHKMLLLCFSRKEHKRGVPCTVWYPLTSGLAQLLLKCYMDFLSSFLIENMTWEILKWETKYFILSFSDVSFIFTQIRTILKQRSISILLIIQVYDFNYGFSSLTLRLFPVSAELENVMTHLIYALISLLRHWI